MRFVTDWSSDIVTRQYSIRIGALAEQDLENLGDYIANVLHSPLAAANTVHGIRVEANTLQQLPERHELDPDPVLAELGVRRTYYKEYKIFYVIDRDAFVVYIVRILHTREGSRAQLYQTLGIVAEPSVPDYQ